MCMCLGICVYAVLATKCMHHAACSEGRTFCKMAQRMRHAACLKGNKTCQINYETCRMFRRQNVLPNGPKPVACRMLGKQYTLPHGACNMPHVRKAERSANLPKACGMPQVWKEERLATWGLQHAAYSEGRTFCQKAQCMRHAEFLGGGTPCHMGHATCRMFGRQNVLRNGAKACGMPQVRMAERPNGGMPHVGKTERSRKWPKTCSMRHAWHAKRIAKLGHAACRLLGMQNILANGPKHAACRMFRRQSPLPNRGMPHAACWEGKHACRIPNGREHHAAN
jgi:hypothetical protein